MPGSCEDVDAIATAVGLPSSAYHVNTYDAVVEPLHAVLGVQALDGHHRHQHLDLADLGRVAREERFDEMGLRALDDDLVDLCDHDAALEGRGLDDGRRVVGVGPGVELALAVGGLGADQRDVWRQVDEVATK